MHTDVLVEVSFLRESLMTAFIGAFERTFASVRSQMVKEVVPFPKNVLAVVEIAFHQLDPSISARVLKSKHSKAPSLWNIVVVDSHFFNVN